jgi:hypothetical protein
VPQYRPRRQPWRPHSMCRWIFFDGSRI